jgi:hypothetical protein
MYLLTCGVDAMFAWKEERRSHLLEGEELEAVFVAVV